MSNPHEAGDKKLVPKETGLVKHKIPSIDLLKKDLPEEQPAPSIFPAWRGVANFHRINRVTLKDNALWAVTDGGVVRWLFENESIRYTRYSSEHGLPGNLASCVAIDFEGRPWVGHDGVGISHFDGRRWHHLLLPKKKQSAKITAIAAGYGGKVWVGTSQGVGYIAEESWHFPSILRSHLPGSNIQTVAIDEQENIWLGTLWGLFQYRPSPKALSRYTMADGLLSNTILSLTVDGQNRLWIGTSQGLCLLEADQLSIISEIDAPILDVSVNLTDDRVWVCTAQKVSCWQDNKWVEMVDARRLLQTYAITETVVTCVTAGTQAQGWAGFTNGLIQYTAPTPRILARSDRESQLTNCVNTIAIDGVNRLWVGTELGLSYQDEDRWRRCQRGDELNADYPQLQAINKIIVSPTGNEIWIASWQRRGLRVLFGDTGEPDLKTPKEASFVEALTCAPNGEIWFANQNRLFRYANNTWYETRRFPSKIGQTRVQSLVATDQSVWCGTGNGLYKWVDNKWALPLLKGKSILSLVFDQEGYLWVGTQSGLFCLRQARSVVAQLSVDDGLPANEIRAIVISKDNSLWVGTNAGLARVTRAKVDETWRAESSGLVDNRIRDLAITSEGKIWVGTSNGLSLFDPNFKEQAC